MQEIDRDSLKIDKRLCSGLVIFAAVLFLVFGATGAYADQVCSDCHDTNPSGPCQHGVCDGGNCAACHGNPPVNAGGLIHPYADQTTPLVSGSVSAGAHLKHATPSGQNYACGVCHYSGMSMSSGQLVGGTGNGNGILQMGFAIPMPGGTTAGGGSYDGILGLAYPYEGTNGTTVTYGGAKTCSGIYCHSDGTSVSAGTIPAGSVSPAWTGGTTTCTSCHGYPPSYANGDRKANSHMASGHNRQCSVCHAATTSDGTTITDPSKHADAAYDLLPADASVDFSYAYNAGGGTCSAVSCHGGVALQWGAVLTGTDCELCHNAAGSPSPLESLSGMGHPYISGSTPTCLQCHATALHTGTVPDAGAIVASVCLTCHGSGGPAHLFVDSQLAAFAGNIHSKSDPGSSCSNCHPAETILKFSMPGVVCTSCHTRPGVLPVTSGTGSVCRACHPTGSYDGFAANIHLTKPTVNFAVTVSGLTASINGAASSCPSGVCSYAWSTTGSGVIAGPTAVSTTISYPEGGTFSITLKVTDSVSLVSVSTSKDVTVVQPNRVPVAGFFAGYPQQSYWTVTVKDNSSDPDTGDLSSPNAITVMWGDGSYSRTSRGGTVTHTYTVANNYTVSLTATDNSGLTSTVTAPVAILVGNVTGVVKNSSGIGQSAVKVSIVVEGATKSAYTNTTGTYTIANVKPGIGYTMIAIKGATAYATQAWVTSGVVGTVNSGNNTVNFTP